MQNLCSARVFRARAWGISVLEFVVRGWNLDIGFWCILFLIIFVVVPQQQVEITESNMQSTKLSWENNEKLRRFRKNVGVFSDFLPRFFAKVLCFIGNLRSFSHHQIGSKLHCSSYFYVAFRSKSWRIPSNCLVKSSKMSIFAPFVWTTSFSDLQSS